MSLIQCPNCGKEIESTEKFCYYCGKGLQEQYVQTTSIADVKYTHDKSNKFLVVCSIISYIAAIIFIALGFHKMFVYSSGELLKKPVNAYVGGDAYNLIINANYATAYFALAIFCSIIGATFIISHLLIRARGE